MLGGTGPSRPAACLELAAGQVAALIGDLCLLPERRRDEVRLCHLLGVGAERVHGSLGVSQGVGVDQPGDRREDEAADREPVGVVAMQPQGEQLAGGARGIG
jgi:hypothetical protein